VSTARVEDIELHYEEHGAGMPLLLIPGIPAVADDWRALSAPLSTSRRAIAFDNRGSGRSTVTEGPYSTEQLAADAAGLLDQLGVRRADVFGIALGGMVAQELALGWPERVDRLILGCTHAGLANAAPQPRETVRAFSLETDDWGERMRALAPLSFSAGYGADSLEAFIETKSRDVQDPAGYRAQINAALGHDTYDRLGEIGSPTLILTGDEDRVIPPLSSNVLHEAIPGSRLVEIEGAGHLFFIENPERTLELIEDFLAQPRQFLNGA
jgi:pimeloyl-ACP methyl ester carboxylesterase